MAIMGRQSDQESQLRQDTGGKPGNRAPEQTFEEVRYLKHLIETEMPVRVKLTDGEEVSGTIEYYDHSFIRLTRKDGPNLFIYKHEIKYLVEEGSSGRAIAPPSRIPSGNRRGNRARGRRVAGHLLRAARAVRAEGRVRPGHGSRSRLRETGGRAVAVPLSAHGIVAEEGGGHTSPSEYRWYVDPLDGTTNFAHSFPIFNVTLALERAGEMLVGVVFDPIRQEMFTAERGSGACLNNRRIRVSSRQPSR